MLDDPGRDPEWTAFLRPLGERRHIPEDTKRRALEQARAIVDAGGTIPQKTKPRPALALRRRRSLQVAFVSLVIVAGGFVAFAAFRGSFTGDTRLSSEKGEEHSTPPAAERRERSSATVPWVTRVPLPAQEPFSEDTLAADIELLRQASASYISRDFSAALALLSDHARRFPVSHLAEEREALRVRSLFGAGRVAEARRASTTFADRFPRSVLLPHVQLGASE